MRKGRHDGQLTSDPQQPSPFWGTATNASTSKPCRCWAACWTPPESELWGAVICVSIVCGLILLCLLRRLVQHYYPNALLIYPVAPRMQRRSPGELSYFLGAMPQSHEPPDKNHVYSGNVHSEGEAGSVHWECSDASLASKDRGVPHPLKQQHRVPSLLTWQCICVAVAESRAAARELEMVRAAEEGRRRAKAKPGSLVINPDGYTYSYAVKIEAVSEGSTSRHSRTGSQALDEAESGGPAGAAGGSSDACGVQGRRAEATGAHGGGADCNVQGSSSLITQADHGGTAGAHGERSVPIQERVTCKGSSGRGVGEEPERCIESHTSDAPHREASSSQVCASNRTQQQI